jgi:hypothetical protein
MTSTAGNLDRLGPAPDPEPPNESPAQVDPTLALTRRRLLDQAEAHVQGVKDFMAVDEGNIYVIDMFLVGVANRSMYLITGFVDLFDQWNVFAAAPLVRLQVDSLLRVSYMTRAEGADTVAAQVLKGANFRSLRDASGHTLTDARLLALATPHHPWLKTVYAAGNDWIHLSTTQVLSPWEIAEEGLAEEGRLGRIKMWFPMRRARIPVPFMRHMLDAMSEATDDLLAYMEIWRRRKGQPSGHMRA